MATGPDPTVSPEGDVPPEGSVAPRRKRRRWGRGFLLSLFTIGALLGGAGAALVKSGPGQRFVLDTALDRVRGVLAGGLTVDEIRSGSLLGGATLVGVRLDAQGGRRFMETDSVRVRYSVLSLMRGVPRIAGVTFFGPRVEISRYAGEERPNVARLLAPRPAMSDTTPGRGMSLTSLEIVDGLLEVLTPLEGPAPAGIPVVPSPVGTGSLRRLSLDALNLVVDDVQLGGPDGDLFTGSLAALAMEVGLLERPLIVTHADGPVRFGPEGLALGEGTFRFPGSAFDGALTLGPRGDEDPGWAFDLDLRTQGPAALADLAWLDPRIPAGVLRGGIGVSVAGGLDVSLDDVRIELEASRLSMDGNVRMDNGVVLRNLSVNASPVDLSRIEPWLDQELPVDGWLSGDMLFDGRPGALRASGRVTLVPTGFGGAPSTADLRGTLHLGADPGATDLQATLEPLNLELVRSLVPAMRVEGVGSARIEASGRVDDGVRFVADLRHGVDQPTGSRVLLRGSALRDAASDWVLDVQGDLSPLSLELLSQVAPGFARAGGVQGSVRVVGPLSNLLVTGELDVAEGRVSVGGRVDLADVGRAYSLDATVHDVRVSKVLASLPDPSRWSGRIELAGGGRDLASAQLTGSITALASRLGGLHIDSLAGAGRLQDGVLTVDTVQARLGGVGLAGSGGFGVVAGASGEARISFETENLVGLRPLLMGDTVMARDTLSVLEQQLLRLQGVDADTLPLLVDVAMSGSLAGDIVVTGNLNDLGVTGRVSLRDGVYGADMVGVAEVEIDARDVTNPGRAVDLNVVASDVVALDRSLTRLDADVRVQGRTGAGSVSALQSSGERYEVVGSFALDSLRQGGVVRLQQAIVDVDSLAWELLHPAEVRWDSTGVTFDEVEVTREGEDPMLLRADGTLAWVGSSDLRVESSGLHLDRVAQLLQREEWALGGHIDLSLRVTGPAAAPLIDGSFHVSEPRYGDMSLTDLTGELSYRDRVAELGIDAMDGDRRVFRTSGSIPVDLALRPEGQRVVASSMDVRVEADSLDASLVLSTLNFLEDVDGVVSGEFRIRGPLDRPEPSGVLHMEGAAWSMEALGVRHTGVTGSLTLNPDRTVDVVVDGRATGTSTVRGRVILDPLTDPRLDLTIGFQSFAAVNRRDMAGLMSGEVRLLGSYRAPRIEGTLSVDRGTLFLEEFARSIEVVDLTDPRIFQVVDTTALASRPLLAGIRNPFLENLRVDIDLSVPRDTWLRSEDMNVEIGGDLLVRYDRLKRDVVMVGELQALRGSYNVLGRRFEVQGGTVSFIGTPGINPVLDIQAMTRIRRTEDNLEVAAAVGGTLTQPRVTLSSDEQGVAESDLVSYLIFGRPSYELANNQAALISGATGAGVTYLSGTLATRLGAALSQQIGIDYLSITQAGQFGVAAGSLAGSLAGTQVEVGQYLGENVFFILIFRPLSSQNPGQGFFGGARVEVALTDDYNVQGFWEDRFLRSRVGGFGDLGIQASQVVGVFIFREWGY